jgi:hypothetical protein
MYIWLKWENLGVKPSANHASNATNGAAASANGRHDVH